MSKAPKDYSVPALEKSIAILNALADEGSMNITDMHKNLQIPKSSIFVILNTLERHEYVIKRDDGKYQLGYGVFQLGMSLYKDIDIRQASRPFIKKLLEDSSFSGHLAVEHNRNAVYIDKVEGSGFIQFATSIGQTVPIHLSAVGKSLLSKYSDEQIHELFPEGLQRLTEKSPTIEELLEELQFIREHGYIIEDEQMEDGIRCVGAPIYGNTGTVVAALSVTALSKDLPAVKFQQWGEKVRDTAAKVSRMISLDDGK